MAHRTKSDLGGFVCRAIGAQRYEVILCTPGPADDPIVLNRIYQFFSQHILNEPGRWWAADMLPSMREVADVTEKVVAQSAS
jgi:hypothetical protein